MDESTLTLAGFAPTRDEYQKLRRNFDNVQAQLEVRDSTIAALEKALAAVTAERDEWHRLQCEASISDGKRALAARFVARHARELDKSWAYVARRDAEKLEDMRAQRDRALTELTGAREIWKIAIDERNAAEAERNAARAEVARLRLELAQKT